MMRRSAVLIAMLASALTIGAAQADPGHLGGLGASLFGDSFFHFSAQNLKSFPISSIRAGRVRIELQHTRLTEVQRAYGGKIYEQGEGMSAAPAGFSPPELGIPGLGASLDDLRAHFGSATVGSHSDVSYRVDRPARDGLGTADDAQYVGYVVRGGRVAGVGVGETTAAH
jgi:hypothetical protein